MYKLHNDKTKQFLMQQNFKMYTLCEMYLSTITSLKCLNCSVTFFDNL